MIGMTLSATGASTGNHEIIYLTLIPDSFISSSPKSSPYLQTQVSVGFLYVPYSSIVFDITLCSPRYSINSS